MLPLAVGLVTLISTIALSTLYCLITKPEKNKLSSANVVLVCSRQSYVTKEFNQKNVLADKEKTNSSGSSSMKIFILFLHNKLILGTKY